MAKKGRKILALFVSIAVVLSLFSIGIVVRNQTSFDEVNGIDRQYLHQLTSLYQKYDTDIDHISEEDTYALRRVMVTGYHGDSYGAVDIAYDKENDFAVLQYLTEDDAKNACLQMQTDGLLAEPDVVMTMDADPFGAYNPDTTAMLGVDTYVDNFKMAKDDVIVAVIDNGVMYDHTGLADRMYSNGVDLSSDEKEDAYYDVEMQSKMYAHGTFVTGIVVNNTSDNVKILPYKVVRFGSESTTSSAIISGINAAMKAGVHVINASLSTTNASVAETFEELIDKAAAKGICICTSTSNDGEEITALYPACCSNAFAVSAIQDNEIASFSNYGECVDFTAPGYRVKSTYPKGELSYYNYWSGTSFSTPFITACCADVKSMNTALSRDEVYDMLAEFSTDLGEEGKDIYYGYGVPNLSDIFMTDHNTYFLRLPQGELSVFKSADYTQNSQPWTMYREKITEVNVGEGVDRIGDYQFYDMKAALFSFPEDYDYRTIGDFAFYQCENLPSMTFDIDVERIGRKAFYGIDDFVIRGYRNTPAEAYALTEKVTFEKLGCKHNYIFEVFDPTDTEDGYTLYTCTVCGDTYIGDYIEPVTLETGYCGENVTYTVYDTGKLIIDGYGEMYDYYNQDSPWINYKDDIKIVEIKKNVETVSPWAFYGLNQIVKIRCSVYNEFLESDEISLVSKKDRELILTAAKGEYTIPDDVNILSAPAFLIAGNIAVNGNDSFTVDNAVIYDKNGNIVCALPSYDDETLKIESNITLRKYAFILTQYPEILDTNLLRLNFEEPSVGFYYDGRLRQTELKFRACDASTACEYADRYGFVIDGYNIGKCGNDMTWRYDENSKSLLFSGTGEMDAYASLEEVPWKEYLSDLKTVTLADGITSVSAYAFYGATELKTLTMPLSVSAPLDENTWYGCTNIKSLHLTYGNGVMDDYVLEDETELYKFTPWYMSSSSITDFSLDPNVKYIGVQAFRNCLAITELTLNCCDKIADCAFLQCSKLASFTNYSKTTEYGVYPILAYRLGKNYGIYKGKKLYAYSDSTSKDYCDAYDKSGAVFSSIGCGHSRNVDLINEETVSCCESYFTYHCNDCLNDFYEYGVPLNGGHTVTITVMSTNTLPINSAEIYLNQMLVASEGQNGVYTVSGVICGEYVLTVKCHGSDLFEGELTVNQSDLSGVITVRYADYVRDGVINAKDYAYALKHDFNDKELFDYGTIGSDDNRFTIDSAG